MRTHCILLLLIPLLVMTALADADDAGLVAYWNFDDGTATDLSGNNQVSLLSGGASVNTNAEFTFGGSGGSLDLNFGDVDTQYMHVDDSPSLSITHELTIAAWIFPDVIQAYDGIVTKGGQNTPAPWGLDFSDSNELEFRPNRNMNQADPNSPFTGNQLLTASVPVEAGEWTLVAFASDTRQAMLVTNAHVDVVERTYIFGKSDGFIEIPLILGCDLPGTPEYFNGLMDEVRIYSRALSARELIAMSGMAEKPYGPIPADGAPNATSKTLSWGSVPDAQSEKVLLGPDPNNLSLLAENVSGTVLFADMQPGNDYAWRVDTTTANGEVTGDVWAFTAAGLTTTSPIPWDGQLFVDPNINLSWGGALEATGYDLYFGTDKAAVAAAESGSTLHKGQLNIPFYDLEGPLDFESSYYWRVDAITADGTRAGEVWEFTTASESGGLRGDYWTDDRDYAMPGLPDASRLDAQLDLNFGPDLPDGISTDWFTARWRGEIYIPFTDTYTFTLNSSDGSRLFINGKLVVDDWSDHDTRMTPGEVFLEAGLYQIRVEYYERQYSASIQVFWECSYFGQEIIPSSALAPVVRAVVLSPTVEATDVSSKPKLQWLALDADTKYDLYLGSDAQAVTDADTSTADLYLGRLNATSYTVTEELLPGTTYYWRVDHVIPDEPEPLKGPTESFTTASFLVIDDMESYTGNEGEEIFQTWTDGIVNQTGGIAGSFYEPFVETILFNGGKQSLPLFYDNDGTITDTDLVTELEVANYSEISRDNPYPDLSAQKELALSFRGMPTVGFSYDAATETYTVEGAGRDVWTLAVGDNQLQDEFYYVYTKLTGDGTITARVDGFIGDSRASQIGVMMRENLDWDSMCAASSISTQGRMLYRYRAENGGSIAQNWGGVTGQSTPFWVRMERVGNNFSAYYSTDGENWTQRDSTQEIPMSETIYIGLSNCPHLDDDGRRSIIATYSHVSLTGTLENTGPLNEASPIGAPDDNPFGPLYAIIPNVSNRGHGMIINDAADLYIVLTDGGGKTAIARKGDPNAILSPRWEEWRVNLATDLEAEAGFDISNVVTIIVGVGDRSSAVPGGDGVVFIDDLRLYD